MLKQALDKIQAEVTAKPKDKYVAVIGGFLMDYVRKNPEHAALIAADGKSIAGSLDAMKEAARKHQSNGIGVLTDEEGFAIVLKYFGVPFIEESPATAPVAPAFDISLDELMA